MIVWARQRGYHRRKGVKGVIRTRIAAKNRYLGYDTLVAQGVIRSFQGVIVVSFLPRYWHNWLISRLNQVNRTFLIESFAPTLHEQVDT